MLPYKTHEALTNALIADLESRGLTPTGRTATSQPEIQELPGRRAPPLDRLRHHVTGAIERGEAKVIVEQRSSMRDTLIASYLDWRNNYLTIECYAEHHGLTMEQAKILVDLARVVFNSDHPDA